MLPTSTLTLGLGGGLPCCLPLCEIYTDQLPVSIIPSRLQWGTYDLASLPELNDIDNLFSSHDWES